MPAIAVPRRAVVPTGAATVRSGSSSSGGGGAALPGARFLILLCCVALFGVGLIAFGADSERARQRQMQDREQSAFAHWAVARPMPTTGDRTGRPSPHPSSAPPPVSAPPASRAPPEPTSVPRALGRCETDLCDATTAAGGVYAPPGSALLAASGGNAAGDADAFLTIQPLPTPAATKVFRLSCAGDASLRDKWPSQELPTTGHEPLPANPHVRSATPSYIRCTARGAVLAYAASYNAAKLAPLVSSFERHAHACDVLVLFVDQAPAAPTFDLAAPNVLLVQWTYYLPEHSRTLRPYLARIPVMQTFLQKHGGAFDVVLHVDSRDTVFMADPLAPLRDEVARVRELAAAAAAAASTAPVGSSAASSRKDSNSSSTADPKAATVLVAVREVHTFKHQDVNQKWVSDYAGAAVQAYLNNITLRGAPLPVLCSGLYGGSVGAVLDLLDLLSCEADRASQSIRNTHGIDQGMYHVALFLMLPATGTFPHHVSVLHDATGPYRNWIPHKAGVHVDAGGRFVNCRGAPYAAVHQYDRHEGLAEHVRRRYRAVAPPGNLGAAGAAADDGLPSAASYWPPHAKEAGHDASDADTAARAPAAPGTTTDEAQACLTTNAILVLATTSLCTSPHLHIGVASLVASHRAGCVEVHVVCRRGDGNTTAYGGVGRDFSADGVPVRFHSPNDGSGSGGGGDPSQAVSQWLRGPHARRIAMLAVVNTHVPPLPWGDSTAGVATDAVWPAAQRFVCLGDIFDGVPSRGGAVVAAAALRKQPPRTSNRRHQRADAAAVAPQLVLSGALLVGATAAVAAAATDAAVWRDRLFTEVPPPPPGGKPQQAVIVSAPSGGYALAAEAAHQRDRSYDRRMPRLVFAYAADGGGGGAPDPPHPWVEHLLRHADAAYGTEAPGAVAVNGKPCDS